MTTITQPPSPATGTTDADDGRPALPTVAVIGAGISGLTSAKQLLDYGVPVTVFETSDRVGGNWAFGNPNGHSSAYRSLHIDTSKHQLSFRDFPMPEDYPDFPHHTQIKAYLDAYCDAFGIREHIEFENGVEKADRLPGGGWRITDQAGAERLFDLLVVANGHHWDPRLAEFPGEFTGASFHSHAYIDPWTPMELRRQRILVVGIGNSAADITVELSQKAFENTVYLSTRSSAWIVPKLIAGKVADKNFRTNPHVPLRWQRKMAQWGQRFVGSDPTLFGLPEANHKFFEAHPTQSSELPLRLTSGDVTPKPNVSRLDGETVHFEDGTSADVDVIVYATGYNLTFPFFDPAFISAPGNRIDLYRRMIKPGLDDLLFVGFAQATPTLFPFVESQARLVGAYAVGAYAPPSEAEMAEQIRADDAYYMGDMLDRPRHTHQLDYFVYEHRMRTQELPSGRRRAAGQGTPAFAGRAARAARTAR